jgi:hypothetical protein
LRPVHTKFGRPYVRNKMQTKGLGYGSREGALALHPSPWVQSPVPRNNNNKKSLFPRSLDSKRSKLYTISPIVTGERSAGR